MWLLFAWKDAPHGGALDCRGVVVNGYANAGAHIYEVMEDFGDERTNTRD